MVPEAPLEQTEAGLVPAGAGWFVLNARDARWNHRPGLARGGPGTAVAAVGFRALPARDEPVIVGAGDGPYVVLAMKLMRVSCQRTLGFYTVDETARRYGASPDEETQDADVAYARFPKSEPSRSRDGWLPSR
jgi:hypothetical protein